MKSHESQTAFFQLLENVPVYLPYEITLLSNQHFPLTRQRNVYLPYEITLLSNRAA